MSDDALAPPPGYEVDVLPAPPAKRRRLMHGHEYGLMRDGTGRGSARFLGSGSGIHFIRNVSRLLGRRSAAPRWRGAHELVPGEEDHFWDRPGYVFRPSKLWDPSEAMPGAGNVSPTFELFVEWSKSYFKIWHPLFPFLHAPTVLQLFQDASRKGLSALNPEDIIIIRSILSISLADRRQSGFAPLHIPIPFPAVFEQRYHTFSSLGDVLSLPPTIRILQAVVSVQIFLTSMLYYSSASRLGGLIVRIAFQLGLHRCPSRYATFSPAEARLRRRLFWTIYCLDRHLSQALGLPLGIRDDDIDVCYPGHELHCTGEERGTEEDRAEDKKLRLLTCVSKHAKIKGMILELRNKSLNYRHEDDDTVTFIQGELARWWNEVQEMLEANTEQSVSMHDSHRLLLRISQQESIIALNRPLLVADKASPSYAAALHTCVGAAREIIPTLQQAVKKSPREALEEPRRKPRPTLLVWPSLTSAVWMSCFILLYAAAENYFPTKSALRNIDNSIAILHELARRGTFWADQCATALSDLRATSFQQPPSSADAIAAGPPRVSQPPRIVDLLTPSTPQTVSYPAASPHPIASPPFFPPNACLPPPSATDDPFALLDFPNFFGDGEGDGEAGGRGSWAEIWDAAGEHGGW